MGLFKECTEIQNYFQFCFFIDAFDRKVHLFSGTAFLAFNYAVCYFGFLRSIPVTELFGSSNMCNKK